ncbi:hypothetical protein MNV49_005364 [Pseudohyphozyma bogoriensis]|nr:hypothetical protein MNV49_005364 [Pseudohyphozyma bogoriensis]
MPALRFTAEAEQLEQKLLLVNKDDVSYEDMEGASEGVDKVLEGISQADSSEFLSTYTYNYVQRFVAGWRAPTPVRVMVNSIIMTYILQSGDPFIHRYFRNHPEDVEAYIAGLATIIPSYEQICHMDADKAEEMADLVSSNVASIVVIASHLPSLPPSLSSTIASSLTPWIHNHSTYTAPESAKPKLKMAVEFIAVLRWMTQDERGKATAREMIGYGKKSGKGMVWRNCQKEGCLVEDNLKACVQCDAVRYCCVEHQKEDWKEHKKLNLGFTERMVHHGGTVYTQDFWRPITASVDLAALLALAAMVTLRMPRWKDWKSGQVPVAKMALLATLIDSTVFIYSATLLVLGVGTSYSMGIAKVFITIFLIERVHMVWGGMTRRRDSRLYKFNISLIALWVTTFVLLCTYHGSEIRSSDESCMIILTSTLPTSFGVGTDIAIDLYLCLLFAVPLWRGTWSNKRIKKLAIKSISCAVVSMGSSAGNLLIFTLLHGYELSWMCLTMCTLDTLVNATNLFVATTGERDADQVAPTRTTHTIGSATVARTPKMRSPGVTTQLFGSMSMSVPGLQGSWVGRTTGDGGDVDADKDRPFADCYRQDDEEGRVGGDLDVDLEDADEDKVVAGRSSGVMLERPQVAYHADDPARWRGDAV